MIYTCPMHPEIEQDHPGNCPICGMTLEPKTPIGHSEEDNAELRDMTRRFWIGAVLSLPVFVLGMAHVFPNAPSIFPASFQGRGKIGVYFEAAAIITVLVLLGQVLELRARTRTGSAIRALLNLTPQKAHVIRNGEEIDAPLVEVHVGDQLRVR